jgi:predicted nucleotidyltransferase
MKFSFTHLTIPSLRCRVIYRNPHVRFMYTAPVQTINDIRHRTATLLKDPDCKAISWVGLFGSFARSTQSPVSDVDMVIGYEPGIEADKVFSAAGTFVMNANDEFGRKVELLHMMDQKVTSSVLLEALLTCVTVHGSEEWPQNVQERSRKFLDDGYLRLKNSSSFLRRLQDLIAKMNKQMHLMENQLMAVIYFSW